MKKDVPEPTEIPDIKCIEIQNFEKELECCFTEIKQQIQQSVIESEARMNFKVMEDKETQAQILDNSKLHYICLLYTSDAADE